MFESCTHSIDRIKQGPADFEKIIEAGRKYEDESFNGRQQLYRLGSTDYATIRSYELNLMFGTYAFQKLSDVHPEATMWGNNNPSWHDILQGNTGNCYFSTALGAIAEFPDVVKRVFITQEKNDAGIYAFRFFIRGKPWIVTVDDVLLFGQNSNGDRLALFQKIGQNNQFWGMLVEKAWAKIKGNYVQSSGGFIKNGFRALVGCPVYNYGMIKGYFADWYFSKVKWANDLNYIMGASTSGDSDTQLNECGIPNSHGYSLISVFELKTGATVDHQLYMLRNPWGVSSYNLTWHSGDSAWTDAYKAQVPHGVDPTTSQNDGIFFVGRDDFATCFSGFIIAVYRDNEGYSDNWYDKENDNGEMSTYEMTLPEKNGDLYFTIESFFQGMVPESCWTGQFPQVKVTIYKNTKDNTLHDWSYYDYYHFPKVVEENKYDAGDKIIVEVQYAWSNSGLPKGAREYTLKVYSKLNLEIKDVSGNTNMWFMDGQFPSGFTKSHYRAQQESWAPEWKPRSLHDVWLVSNSIEQFLHYVFQNPQTLYVWFSS